VKAGAGSVVHVLRCPSVRSRSRNGRTRPIVQSSGGLPLCLPFFGRPLWVPSQWQARQLAVRTLGGAQSDGKGMHFSCIPAFSSLLPPSHPNTHFEVENLQLNWNITTLADPATAPYLF
jgi:hypothetical protein